MTRYGDYEEPGEAAGEPPAPVPDSQGTYAVYRTPKGAIHLVYRPQGAEEDQHMEVPPFAVELMDRAQAGEQIGLPSVMKAAQKLMRGGK